jgi:hypothetical protein
VCCIIDVNYDKSGIEMNFEGVENYSASKVYDVIGTKHALFIRLTFNKTKRTLIALDVTNVW